jgi:hypothetical protein
MGTREQPTLRSFARLTLRLAAVLVRKATIKVVVEPLERLAKEKSDGQR